MGLPPMTDQSPAPLDVRPGGARRGWGVSIIWMVPLIALIVILSVAYQTYQDRGVLIEIAFENGSGISTDTPIRYRDIEVGTVEKVTFSTNLADVIVAARIDKTVAPFLDDDARFWVVEPDVTLRGVSGLDTVLSGVYIAGSWDTQADVAQTEFIGLDEPPLVSGLQDGLEILLRASNGRSLAQGAPILHKGLQVGFLDEPILDPNGLGVTVVGFIEGPFVNLVTTNTRFWDTSGFSFTVGAEGLGLNVDSIASLIEGGIAFDTVVSGGNPIGQSNIVEVFDIFDSEIDARESLFESPDRSRLTVGITFDENINGLTTGSAVKYQGVRVGEVTAINAEVVEEDDRPRVQLRTTLEIVPTRLGISDNTSEEDALFILAGFVAQGMRARLVTGNILTGALEVELVDVENAPIAFLDTSQDPYPIIPTTASDLSDVADTAEGVLSRINELPIEELLEGAISLMASVEALATDGSLQAAPEELLSAITDVRALIGSEGVQTAPESLQAALNGVEEAVAQANAILAQAQEVDLIGGLATTIDSTNTTVGTINTAAAELPDLIAQFEALTTKATALELEALVAQATASLAEIDAFVASEGVTALPNNVNFALAEVRTLVAALREGGAVENLNAALTAASEAADSVATSVETLPALSARADALLTQLQGGTENLPQISAQLETFITTLNAAELDALAAQANAALAEIEALTSNESTVAIPDNVNAALADLQTLLTQVSEGGAVENLNTALTAASEAANSVAASVEDLPALTARADAVLAQLQTATENLPTITAEIEALVTKANAVEIDALVAQAEGTLANISTFVSAESTQALPASLNETLTELDALLSEIRAGGAVNNVNAMLASASEAAAAVETAAEGLPALSTQAAQLVATINSVAAVYGERGRFTADTAATLRDIQEAADAVSNLARAIQRNPSSLLTGR